MDFRLPKIEDHGNVFLPFAQTQQWGIPLLKVEDVWKRGFTGKGVINWIFDTEVLRHEDLHHDQLRIQYFASANGKSEHGTHVSGITCAINDNKGVVGIAPGSEGIVNMVVLSDQGYGAWNNTETALKRMIDILKANEYPGKRHVVNMSMGANISSYPPGIVRHVKTLYEEYGVIFVGAAGNSGHDGNANLSFPSVLPEFISTGSIDNTGKISKYSSYGKGIDIMAPGSYIISTVGLNQYKAFSGTSMATPFVSGVVTLMLDMNPDLTPEQVYDAITTNAIDMHVQGVDDYTGYGLISPVDIMNDLVGDGSKPIDNELQDKIDQLTKELEKYRRFTNDVISTVSEFHSEIEQIKKNLA